MKTYRPKNVGGLGLYDPSTLKKIFSPKIWWHWLKHPKYLWARLWRRKYTPTTSEENLIRWNGHTPGSLIWNAGKQNNGIIVDHAFWEIQDGNSTSFWNDS